MVKPAEDIKVIFTALINISSSDRSSSLGHMKILPPMMMIMAMVLMMMVMVLVMMMVMVMMVVVVMIMVVVMVVLVMKPLSKLETASATCVPNIAIDTPALQS